jgi:hypothetical protein
MDYNNNIHNDEKVKENERSHSKINDSLKLFDLSNLQQTEIFVCSVCNVTILMPKNSTSIFVSCNNTKIAEFDVKNRLPKRNYYLIKTKNPTKDKYDHEKDYKFEYESKHILIKKFNRNNKNSLYKQFVEKQPEKKHLISVKIRSGEFLEEFAIYIGHDDKPISIYTPINL